jgi:hypothetical protein
MRSSFNGNGNEARIVNKRLRLSSFNSFYVTIAELRNGLRNLNRNRLALNHFYFKNYHRLLYKSINWLIMKNKFDLKRRI